MGSGVIDFGIFNWSVYRRWTRVLNAKGEDGSIETNDSEVHSGARGFITVLEELMNWM